MAMPPSATLPRAIRLLVVFLAWPVLALATERTFVDRPDDVTGYQVHFLYVVPSDGVDQGFDVDGSIASAAHDAQAWLRSQTGGRGLRFDMYQGQLDITFFRSAQSDAQLLGPGIRAALQTELRAAGLNHPLKVYAVLYGGNSPSGGACGYGAGRIALLLLNRAGAICVPHESWGYVFLHEVFHVLGMVSSCAPHYAPLDGVANAIAHVSDDPFDIMNPTLGGKLTLFLDRGHDDYYEANIVGCPDLADSIFLDPPRPTATPPPSWPIPLVAQSCEREAILRPRASDTPIAIDFINSGSGAVQVYRLNSNGQRELVRTLPPGTEVPIGLGFTTNPTYVTHPWVMTDTTGQCLAVFSAEASDAARGDRYFGAILDLPASTRLGLNANRFRPGETLTLGIHGQNPGASLPTDLYVGVLAPNGSTAVFFDAAGAVAGARALAAPSTFPRTQTLAPGTSLAMPQFFQFTFPASGLEGGTYVIFSALVRQQALVDGRIDAGDIVDLDIQPVTFSP